MAQKYRIRTGSDATLSTLNSALSNTTFERVLTDRDQTFSEQTDINGDVTGYAATVYAADPEPRDSIETELQDVVSSATTATIQRRHVWRDYDDTRIADPTYYPSHISDGLRADPTLTTDGWGVAVNVDSLHAGSEASAAATLTFEQPTDYMRRDRLVVDDTGLSVLSGTAVGEPAITGEQTTAPDVPTDAVSVAVVTVKQHIDRIPHGGINAATQVGEASDRTTVYEK